MSVMHYGTYKIRTVMSVMHYGTITEPLRTWRHSMVFDALRGHFTLYIDKNWHGDLLAHNLLPSLFLMKSEHQNPSYSAFKPPLRTLLSADTIENQLFLHEKWALHKILSPNIQKSDGTGFTWPFYITLKNFRSLSKKMMNPWSRHY